MARTDHYVGLNAWAKKLVHDIHSVSEKGIRTFQDGRQESFDRNVEVNLVKVEQIGEITVMHCQFFPRHRYTMPDGRVYEEYLQASPWSGGPHLYMGLKRVTYGKRKYLRVVKESLWTDSEMGC